MEGHPPMHQVDDLARVRIVLLPVGGTSTRPFGRYCDEIRRVRSVDFRDLDRTQLPGASSSAFKEQRGKWDEGQILLTYVGAGYHAAPWDAFQAHRSALVVFGVVYCPEVEDLEVAWELFRANIQGSLQWGGAAAVHCLAFEPSEHQLVRLQKLEGVVGVTLHVVPGPDPVSVHANLHHVFSVAAQGVISALERSVDTAEQVNRTVMTPCDTGTDAFDHSAVRRIRAGRISKRQADYCLLAGCIKDAAARYASTLEPARAAGDHLCVAGALEGLATCAVLLETASPKAIPITHMRQRSVEKWDAEMPARGGVREAIGRLNEAGKIYDKKKAGALHSSCILRLASVHASSHRGGGVRWGSRVDVFEALWRAEAAAEGLPLTDRIAVIGSCAALAGRIGCWRGMAASVRKAAQVFAAAGQWQQAHQAMLVCAGFYQLDVSGLEPSFEVVSVLPSLPKVPQGGTGKFGWFSLQGQVMADLLSYARASHDAVSVSRYLAYALPTLAAAPLQGAEAWHVRQRSLVNELTSARDVTGGPVRADIRLPRLVGVRCEPLPVHLAPSEGGGDTGEGRIGRLFLYCAFDRKEGGSRKVVWAEGESASVTLVFSNPFMFPVPIDVVDLVRVGDAELTLIPVSVTLPAASPASAVTCKVIVGERKEDGEAGGDGGRITGCKVLLWNFEVEMTDVGGIGGGWDVSKAKSAGVKGQGGRGGGGGRGGKGTDEEEHDPTSFSIVPPLPLATMSCDQLGGRAHAGEERCGTATIHNTGSLPITAASLAATPNSVLSFDSQPLTRALPLPPRASVSFQVSIVAPALIGDTDATLSLSYSSAGGGLRTCKHGINMQVENAPAISSIQIMLATLPHFSWQTIPSKTSGEGAESEVPLARDFAFEMDEREPLGEKVEAVEGGREVCACAVLDVENESLQPFTLYSDITGDIATGTHTEWSGGGCIEGRSSARVIIPFRRFRLCQSDFVEQVSKEHIPRLGEKAISHAERVSQAREAYLRRYTDALLNRLRLRWVHSSGSTGVPRLINDAGMTEADLDSLRPPRAFFNLALEPTGVSLDGSASCKSSGEVGAFHRASVVFKNVSEEAMCDMVCTVSAKAEGQDTGDGIVAVGATESMWSDVPPGGKVTHEVEFCFLEEGNYAVSARCTSRRDLNWTPYCANVHLSVSPLPA